MRTEFLGTVVSVVDRPYTKKDGTPGVAHVVSFNAGGQTLVDELYRSDADWEKMGCKYGAIGTIVIDVRNEEKKTQTGRSFMVNSWRFVDFKLANAGGNNATTTATASPEFVAPEAGADEVKVEGKDLPY